MNAFSYPSKRGINFAKIRGFKVTDYNPHARGQSVRETHAPGHITLWLHEPCAPRLTPPVALGKLFSGHRACYFHTPFCNWLKIKILENAPWK